MYPLELIQKKFLPSGLYLQVFTMYIGYQSNVTKLYTSVSVPNKTGRFMNFLMNISNLLLIFYWLNEVV
jgi:hypothetical protein